MGEKTGVEWTDATVNFWRGCTKVGPGCLICYAEAFDKRVGGSHWGVGKRAAGRMLAGRTHDAMPAAMWGAD